MMSARDSYAVFEGTGGGSGVCSSPIRDVPVPVYYLDENYAVIGKPHNVPMDTPKHAKKAGGDDRVTVESLLSEIVPVETKLYWVHQLDSATSGALCIGLNKKAARMASQLFESRQVAKEYLALVWGHVPSTPPHSIGTPKTSICINMSARRNESMCHVEARKREAKHGPSASRMHPASSRRASLC